MSAVASRTRRNYMRQRTIGAATVRLLREDQAGGGFRVTGTFTTDFFVGRKRQEGTGLVVDAMTIDEGAVTPADVANTPALVIKTADAFEVLYEDETSERFVFQDKTTPRLGDVNRTWLCEFRPSFNDATAVIGDS